MKTCSYCGAEYPDDGVQCVTDHTPLDPPAEPPAAPPPVPGQRRPEYEFAPLLESQKECDLVTLMRCRTLMDADMVVSRLRAAGIDAFVPDEFLMQVVAWNLNTYGYVRVQIALQDYEAAKELLSEEQPSA